MLKAEIAAPEDTQEVPAVTRRKQIRRSGQWRECASLQTFWRGMHEATRVHRGTRQCGGVAADGVDAVDRAMHRRYAWC
jgi:hypothetical protein